MIRRLFRAVFLAGLVAGGVAAFRALTRPADPLPQPATAPTGGPWPPLHNESPTPSEAGSASATPGGTALRGAPASTPAPGPSKPGTATEPPGTEPAEPDAVVAPEPGGTPVADAPAEKAAARKRTRPLEAPKTWAEPVDGGCPDGYPIKAKMSSKIFHSPGQLNYDRTTPDRCYVDTDSAEADGLRAAKR